MIQCLSIPVGIIVARTEANTTSRTPQWRPVAILIGQAPLEDGGFIRHEQGADYFFAGISPLALHATEIESYQWNLEQEVPRIYVVLKPNAAGDEHQPPYVHLITVAPDGRSPI